MAESKIKDENYYQVSGWMINKLNLKGTPLNVFAIIYGFSQDGESEFNGSRQYLADFTNSTKPTVDKALNELCELDYIIKNQKIINNVTFNSYKANLPVVKKHCWGSKETLPPSKENCAGGSKETLPNNKDLDNDNNNKDKKERKKAETAYDIIINEMITSEELKANIYEFIKMRKLSKKPMTDFALKKMINKLFKLSNDTQQQISILENSILNNWQDIYAPKGNNGGRNNGSNKKADGSVYARFG